MLSVIMLSVIMLSFAMMSVVMLNVAMLNVVAPKVPIHFTRDIDGLQESLSKITIGKLQTSANYLGSL